MCALKVFENKASQEYKRPDQNFFLKINKREGPNKKFREIKKLPPPVYQLPQRKVLMIDQG